MKPMPREHMSFAQPLKLLPNVLLLDFQPQGNRLANVFQRLLTSLPLGPATRQRRASHGEFAFGLDQNDGIGHAKDFSGWN